MTAPIFQGFGSYTDSGLKVAHYTVHDIGPVPATFHDLTLLVSENPRSVMFDFGFLSGFLFVFIPHIFFPYADKNSFLSH
jgi:hypothetical protein